MSGIEVAGAILLIICCLAIIILVLNQDSSKGLSQSLTGSSNDNFFQKNSGRTKEATLKRFTKTATILLFVVTIAVNVFAIFGKPAPEETVDDDAPTIDISDQLQIADAENPEIPLETLTPDEDVPADESEMTEEAVENNTDEVDNVVTEDTLETQETE